MLGNGKRSRSQLVCFPNISLQLESIAMMEFEDEPPPSQASDALPLLTERQIEFLVKSYKREMARYEKAGLLIGDRLRSELRQAGVKHMISSRLKHPDDLAGKLRKKAREKPHIYKWDSLQQDLGSIVTDLAGCRVVVYSADDEHVVGNMVGRFFAQPQREDATARRRRSLDEAYWATHALIHPYSPDDHTDPTIDGTICELQIVTAAAHLFNEIEHDITYKDRDAGLQANDPERQLIDELRGVARIADRLVLELLNLRARRRKEGSQVISTPEELKFVLSDQAGKSIDGEESSRLLGLLDQCLDRVTPAAIREMGPVNDVIDVGKTLLGGKASEYAETILYTVGLLKKFTPEIKLALKGWRGPRTAMRRAIDHALAHMPTTNMEAR